MMQREIDRIVDVWLLCFLLAFLSITCSITTSEVYAYRMKREEVIKQQLVQRKCYRYCNYIQLLILKESIQNHL